MLGKLPLSVDLISGETPASFAARLGRKNGSEYATDFCMDRGFRLQDVADGRAEALSSLALLGGESCEDLGRFAVKRIGETQYSVAGQALEKRWIQRSRLRFCPHCVAADLADKALHGVALRAQWHVPFVRTCHHHHVPILELDKICHVRGPHDFTGRLVDLGVRPDKLLRKESDRLPSPLELYLMDRITGSDYEPWLDSLPFNAVAMASEALGLMLAFGDEKQIGALSPGERIQAGAAGFEVVRAGEQSVRDCLAGLHRKGGSPTWFQRRFYGYFFLWLEASHSSLYAPIKKIMRDHIVHTYPIEDGEIVLGEPCERRRVYSITTLKKATGIEPKKLKHILHANGLLGKDPKTGKFEQNVLFKADDVDPIVAPFRGSICQLAARRRLNAPRAQFDVLLKAGFIEPIPGGSDVRPSYDPAKIDEFISQMLKGAVPVDDSNDRYVDIQTACRKTVSGAAEIVDLIMTGRLDFVGYRPDQNGYAALRIDPDEVAKRMRLTAPKGYMKHELRELLGVNDPTIRHLNETGFLPVVKSRHPVSRKSISIVTYQAMAVFLENYVPAKLMAEVWNIHVRSIGNGLIQRGGKMLPLPKGCRGRIFYRNSIQHIVDRRVPGAKCAASIFSNWHNLERTIHGYL